MSPESFLHERNDFKELIQAVAQSEQINDPALVEKDYWIMHALFGLKLLGLTFQLKGGTSLSKGFRVIDRFSEDIDIRIEPFDGLKFDENPNHNKPQHIESRREFFDKLQQKIKIPGVTAVERDPTYDTKTMRNAGLRLRYETLFDPIPGLKDGVLLEVGSDQTSPYRAVTISSWVIDFEGTRNLRYTENRAVEIPCYNPEYTFVEKLQTVIHKYRQFETEQKVSSDFLRHYYDIHRLLDLPEVQKFIGTSEYLRHKTKRFKSLDQNVAKSAAFSLPDEKIRKQFETEYKKTAALYYRGQIPLDQILTRIQKDLPRL